MTALELANKVQMSKQQINQYINGHTKTPTIQIAMNIATALNCKIEDLYEWKKK
jgi:DNA-binding XRE family transcriptional regulator